MAEAAARVDNPVVVSAVRLVCRRTVFVAGVTTDAGPICHRSRFHLAPDKVRLCTVSAARVLSRRTEIMAGSTNNCSSGYHVVAVTQDRLAVVAW